MLVFLFAKCLLQDTGPGDVKPIPVSNNIHVLPALSKRHGGDLLRNVARLYIIFIMKSYMKHKK